MLLARQQPLGPSLDLQKPILALSQDHLAWVRHQPHQEQATVVRILIILISYLRINIIMRSLERSQQQLEDAAELLGLEAF